MGSKWLLAAATLLAAGPAWAQADRALIRSGDTVVLAVADQAAMSHKYIVQPDGTVTVPLIGEVKAEGQTADQLGADLRTRLLVFFKDPKVHVEIERPHRVFVLGAVKTPGPLDLTQNMTLLEALTRSGYSGTPEVVVVRSKGFGGPVLIDEPGAELIRVNLRDFERDIQSGRLSQNVMLGDGDTIYVPAVDPNEIYVSGQVRKPGSYSIPEGTTILQALSLAGGANEQAALGRVSVVRLVDGEQKTVRGKLDDAIKPGDTVVVPEKIPFPVIDIGTDESANRPGQIHVGSALTLRPAAAIKRFGVDSNVFNDSSGPKNDFTIVAGPQLETVLDLRRVRVKAKGDVDFIYFREFASERSVSESAAASVDLSLSRRLRIGVGGGAANASDRLNAEVDTRVRRFEHSADALILVQPWRRLDLEVAGRDFDRTLNRDAMLLGVNLRETLTEHLRTASATVRLALTSLTSIVLSGGASTHRFPLFPQKDADTTEFTVGGLFKTGALISGDIGVGYLRYLTLDVSAPDSRGLIGHADLFYDPKERTRFHVTLERFAGDSFQPQFSFAIIDRGGGSVRQGLFRRFDVLLETYREKYGYRNFIPVRPNPLAGESAETTQRYGSELGVRVGQIRVGFNATYVQRLSTDFRARNYNSLRMMANVSYGALEVRGR